MALLDMMTSFTAFLKALKKIIISLFTNTNLGFWLPHAEVHGSDCEKRESVDFNHDKHES